MPPKKAVRPATKTTTRYTTLPSLNGSAATGTDLVGTNTKKRKAEGDETKRIVNGVKRSRRALASGDLALKRKASTQTQAATTRKAKTRIFINKAPTERLEIYVFGAGEMGELGLGRSPGQNKVKRPRYNPLLAADKVGVVTLSIGGMHTAALTHDNRILTWGVNDDGALGRNTDEDEHGDDDFNSDTGLNYKESTPSAIDTSSLPVDIVWTQLACTDSATFALTEGGSVYGWGTFRGNEGIMGFDPFHKYQRRPVQIPGLSNIVQLAGGSNHVLALSNKGEVYAWGAGQQGQLGRRIVERRKLNSLIPIRVGLPKKIIMVGAGSYHSFAVKESGEVYAWGLNSFGETGVATQIGDGGESVVHQATIVESLRKFGKVICIDGGSHHTVAVTNKGELIVWGRLDRFQLGLQVSSLPERDVIRDPTGLPRILKIPVQIPNIDAGYASAGSDHCVAVARDGNAYAWGFSENYQTGLGQKKDVEIATLIDAIKAVSSTDSDNDASDEEDGVPSVDAEAGRDEIGGKKMVWAGCAAQFSILASVAATEATDWNRVNGHV